MQNFFSKLPLLFLLLLVLIAVWSCGENSSTVDNTPPAAPVMISRSPDDVYPQRGIRAEPVTSDRQHLVRIEWRKGPESDIAGYRIYRTYEWDTTESGALLPPSLITTLTLDPAITPDTVFWVDGQFDNSLAPDTFGTTRGFYWQVQAFDNASDPNFSEISSRVYYRLLNNPSDLQVVRINPGVYNLSWNIDSPLELSYYKLRIYSNYLGRDSVYWNPPIEQRYNNSENIILYADSLPTPFRSDCTYVWQLNAVSLISNVSHREALAGSAAKQTFVYQN